MYPYEQRLVLFGAGNLGKKALWVLREQGIEPLAFTDNSARLWGQTIEGIPVLAPGEAARQFGRSAAFVVTAFSPACNYVPLEQQLRNFGLRTDRALRGPFLEVCRVLPAARHGRLAAPRAGRPRRRPQGLQLFYDDASRREFVAQVRWRLRHDFAALPPPSPDEQYFPDDLFALRADERFVDCGAFDGDTIRSLLKRTTDFGRIVAFEPDPVNFQRLRQCVAEMPPEVQARISLGEVAVAAARGTVRFQSDGTAGARILDEGPAEVACDSLQNLLAGLDPSFIKLDVEGAEHEALYGAQEILARGRAIWAVCVYHKQSDLWQLPLLLRSCLPRDYQLFLRKHGGEIFDTVCYAVPAERLVSVGVPRLEFRRAGVPALAGMPPTMSTWCPGGTPARRSLATARSAMVQTGSCSIASTLRKCRRAACSPATTSCSARTAAWFMPTTFPRKGPSTPTIATCPSTSGRKAAAAKTSSISRAFGPWQKSSPNALPDRGARILDVGCAIGGMLAALKDLGYENLLGVDPSPACAEAAAEVHGVEVLTGTLANLPHVDRKFDLIVLSNILEHVRDLKPALRRICDVLAPGGMLFVQVPDASRFAHRDDAALPGIQHRAHQFLLRGLPGKSAWAVGL